MSPEVGTEMAAEAPQPDRMRVIVWVAALVYILVSAYALFALHKRVSALEEGQAAAQKQIASLNSDLKATSSALASQVGMTEKELAAKTGQLQKAQRAAESRLTSEQQEQAARAHNEYLGVATEVGSVKTDVAATKTDLEVTKAKLEKTIGDLGVQSGLIARTGADLEILKHKGDRNYYEFSLQKGGHPVPVSTISLQLKKTDAKKNRFTLNVLADDKTIEKKDRNAFEPLQFYTGKDHLLYELVVNNVEKNKVSGYLATPKGAPVPITP
jgi:hypothetical protein